MKNLKYVFTLLLISTVMIAAAQTKEAKKAAKLAEIKALVDNKNFDFIAQYVTPQAGARRYLTSTYDLAVKKDSLIAFLPFFGEGYFDIPYNPTDGGIKFTSTDYKYTATARKKGGWNVVIEPRDIKYYNRITMFIFPEGSATLDFSPTNKSHISFDGYIQKFEAKK